MMFSTRATYGLKALLYMAHLYSERAVSASQIAKEEGLSAAYLEQILHQLKKKQWIKSLRGPAGGYVLAKKPSEIKIGSVLRDLEGKKMIGTHAAKNSKAGNSNTVTLASDLFWNKVNRQVAEILDSATLRSLIDESHKFQKTAAGSERLHFNI